MDGGKVKPCISADMMHLMSYSKAGWMDGNGNDAMDHLHCVVKGPITQRLKYGSAPTNTDTIQHLDTQGHIPEL